MKIRDYMLNLEDTRDSESEKFLMQEFAKILKDDPDADMIVLCPDRFITFSKIPCRHATGYNMSLVTPRQNRKWLYSSDIVTLTNIYQHFVVREMFSFKGSDAELVKELTAIIQDVTEAHGV